MPSKLRPAPGCCRWRIPRGVRIIPRFPPGTLRFIAKDTSKGATPYGQVAFPREGLEKMGLANDPNKEGPFTIYARIHVFAQKDAAAISVAVGTKFSTDAQGKTFGAALEDFPFSDAARPPLFRAAMQQSKYQVAVSAMEPLVETGTLAVVSPAPALSGTEPEARSESASSPNPLGISQSDRAGILAGLARALEKLERYDQAVTDYQQAIRLEKAPSTKADLLKDLHGVRTILNRRKLNLARQPLVRPELEQANVVRPRLQVPQNVSPPRPIPAKAKPLTSAQGTRRTQ